MALINLAEIDQKIFLDLNLPPFFYRCEAINKANERVPAVARIHYRVFFPPKSLSILVERPDKGSGYDRTIDFEAGLASNIRGRKYEDIRIVVAEELVRIRCEAGM